MKAGNRMWYEVDLKKGKTRVVKLGMVAATGKRIGVWTREIRTKSGICVAVPFGEEEGGEGEEKGGEVGEQP